MQLHHVIRKYRKEKGLTQEEMANTLGVTASAVNKWERGNALPDITLLGPIARLLSISLEELLSFREELTPQEIENLVKEGDRRFSEGSYDEAFAWAREQILQNPDCEPLIHSLALQMDTHRLTGNLEIREEQEAFILRCYERLGKSKEESMRMAGADALYGYYFRREEYDKAREALSCLSIQNPERKRKLGELYEKTGEPEKAYQVYEEILLAEHQILSMVLQNLFCMELKKKDWEKAAYYGEKKKELARLFEMGEYEIFAGDLELARGLEDRDKTLACMEGMLENVDSLGSFVHAPLYRHMTFRPMDADFPAMVRKTLLDILESDEFAYMEQDPRWKGLAERYGSGKKRKSLNI